MKETTQETRVRARMMPGAITLSGFLGKDKRALNAIVSADEQELQRLERTPEELAERMQYFSEASFSTFDGSTTIEEIYLVETEVTRGKLSCPFAHGGTFRKAITKLTNKRNNVIVTWTALNIHLIGAHHFFEGKGSAYRVDPAQLVEALY